ncbi:hypothetical protein PRNP1_010978 [Phytophthora ramorum]
MELKCTRLLLAAWWSIAITSATVALDTVIPIPRQGGDPVYRFHIVHPANGSVVKLPLKFSTHMGITSMERYVAYYTGKRVCIEFQDVVTKCNSVLHPDIIFHDLPEGHHTARAFVTDDGGVERQHLTSPTWFSIVSEEEYDVHAANVVEQSRASLHLPRDVNLLEWMEERHEKLSDNGNSANTSITLHADGTEPVLVIGIKTAVVTNFARRQAIRDTWAQDARKYGAKVVFLGCNPNMRGVHDESEQRYLQDAVNMEKKVYGDLLTDELECEDSYGLLAEKVVAFFHLAAAEFAQTPYVMIADDDIYLRVDKLIQLLQQKGRRKRMYMGQAWGSSFTRISSPVRQESHQNYLPKHQYPMNKLLPYAFGPHYVISMDYPAKPALVVAYAPSASFSHVVLECLFASVFEALMRPMLVIPANLLEKYYGISPDVFVFSPLGGKCNPAGAPACQKMVAEYFERYSAGTTKSVDSSSRNKSGATKADRTTQLVMLSGEAWSTDGLDERVLLISTLANANRTKHIHLSMASASFAERLDHGPLSLLSPSDTKTESPKTKFCAYLYAHCDRSDRELMYDALNALRPVDALGKCAGSSTPPDQTKMASRLAIFYNDDAVRRYAPYKFVLAFENTRATGYVTEKLVNAFLAGSVPVYWGDSKTVSELFNPESFIDCGRFDSLQDCAEYVVHVDDSPEMYTRMRREAPVANMTAFNEAFSWHPTVPSRFMADAVLRHFHN